jgi:cytochrome c biogenesis protein CcmG/thiol:disulfide interchange protein DsbE
MALQQRGVPVLGVAYKDEPADTEAFLHELGDPFSVVALDPDGRFALELGTAGVPETFVIGADGRILALHRGPLTDDVIAEKILPALGAP